MRLPQAPHFAIPAFLYALLATASAIYGAFQLLPVVLALQTHPTPIGDLIPQISFTIIWLAVTAFYAIVSVALFSRRHRKAVIVGASISCILLPFGTIAGVLVLTWTRPRWPKDQG